MSDISQPCHGFIVLSTSWLFWGVGLASRRRGQCQANTKYFALQHIPTCRLTNIINQIRLHAIYIGYPRTLTIWSFRQLATGDRDTGCPSSIIPCLLGLDGERFLPDPLGSGSCFYSILVDFGISIVEIGGQFLFCLLQTDSEIRAQEF